MRTLALLLCVAFAGCATTPAPEVVAYQAGMLDAAQAMPGATTAFNTSGNPNIRGADGRLVPSRLTTDPQVGEIYIASDTGETLTTPSDTVIKSTTLSLGGAVRGRVVNTPADGSITLKDSGLYKVDYCLSQGDITADSLTTLKLFRKDGAASAAEESPTMRAVSDPTSVVVNMCATGFVTVTAAQAVTPFQIFDVRATAAAGNIVVKGYRLTIVKVDELDPAQP